MKRLAALLAASLLLAGCTAAHKAVQVPEYPWDTTQPAVQQACPDAVAETWTQKEQDAWAAAMREHYDWENHEPTAGTVNGVEKEIYHADEAAKVYLENNYEAVVSYQGQEGSDGLLIATRLLPPQPASAPAA